MGAFRRFPACRSGAGYGSEIIAALDFRHYISGLSLDTVIQKFAFYWNLTLRKPQADAMLNRLAKEWLPEFDAQCPLLAGPPHLIAWQFAGAEPLGGRCSSRLACVCRSGFRKAECPASES